jgi:MFS family permease
MSEPLERNLRLIPWHELLVRTSPWIAVFVLFTRANFDLDGALRLASIYYLSVVVFEVPSGWMSDRVGRALTLRVAGLAWVLSFTCFIVGANNFMMVALGQILLAGGYASLSGTDVTFHFDTLEALGRSHEYGRHQARVASRGLVFGAVGALIGGAVGLVDLRMAFVASMVLALIQLAIAMQFTEPPRTDEASGFVSQISECLSYLRHIPLGWIFGYGIAMVVLEHVAFTLMQPWLTEALGRAPDELGSAPLVSGSIYAGVALIGAIFARASIALSERFGLRTSLVALGVLSATIVAVMAASTSVLVIVLFAFRSAQGSAAPVLISAAVAPELDQRHRATFLSLDSLAGRLAYGTLLFLVAADIDDDVTAGLVRLSFIAWLLVALTAVTAFAVHRRYD